MAKIDDFKLFVKKYPELVKYVKDGSSTWQKFYEIYDIYGESESAWKNYIKPTVTASTDLLGWIKNINIDDFQNSINSLQRVLGVVQDLSLKDEKKPANEYKPRPIYKHFED